MRWGLFARPRGRHAAGTAPARYPVQMAVAVPVPVPRAPAARAQPPSGVQLTFVDGSSLDLPESSPYTLAMRATAAVLVSSRHSTDGSRRR